MIASTRRQGFLLQNLDDLNDLISLNLNKTKNNW